MTPSLTASRSPIGGSFHHEALLYDGDEAYLDATIPFIRDGLDAEEPVLVVVGSDKIELLRGALGTKVDAVSFVNMTELGRNPARIIPVWQEFLDGRQALEARDTGISNGSGDKGRGIGEPIWAGRSTNELIECQRHEHLLNIAFRESTSFRLLCPYNTALLDDSTIDEARRSHLHVTNLGVAGTSNVFGGRYTAVDAFSGTLPPPPDVSIATSFKGRQALQGIRELVRSHAYSFGLSPSRVDDAVIAVNELATNSVCHGGGEGHLRLWPEHDTQGTHTQGTHTQGTDSLVIEIEDAGTIVEALAGRSMPLLESDGGRGLWLVNQLCDLVQVRSSPERTVVRIHMRL